MGFSVRPNVWGHKHNVNIWNKSSCDIIGCWRPSVCLTLTLKDKSWVCDRDYSCMKSITVTAGIAGSRKIRRNAKIRIPVKIK